MDFHRSLLRRSKHDYTAGDRQHLVAKRRKRFIQKFHISSLILKKIPKANQLSSPDSGQHFQVNNYFFLASFTSKNLHLNSFIILRSQFYNSEIIMIIDTRVFCMVGYFICSGRPLFLNGFQVGITSWQGLPKLNFRQSTKDLLL